ncbi:MAG: SH3 domain-containing protein [Scytolyngbya sp. HA4215-MV1]|nr:SH3 domain-containing protein [Scytolyngbya sp. HA4215-MV1]
MKKKQNNHSDLGKRVVLFAIAAIAAGSAQTPILSFAATTPATVNSGASHGDALPNSLQPGEFQIAQLSGSCRRLNHAAAVYEDSAVTSKIVANLVMGTVVKLAANTGVNGLIEIDAPAKGYLEPKNLSPKVPCPVTTPPADRCRKVLNPPEGLIIREKPQTSARLVGGVAKGATVTLTSSPPNRSTDASGRIWVEISQPIPGWVSNGYPNNPSNLIYCP